MIVVYEDAEAIKLRPLIHLRPVFDLRCGCRTLLEKIRACYPKEPLALLVRPALAPLVAERFAEQPSPFLPVRNMDELLSATDSGQFLFLSGQTILDRRLPVAGADEIFVNGRQIVGFRISAGLLRKLCMLQRRYRPKKSFPFDQQAIRALPVPRHTVLCAVVRHPWDLIALNESELRRELRQLKSKHRRRIKPSGVHVIGAAEQLVIDPTATVQPGVVFDLTLGGIILENRAEVRAGSIVAGPCYIGPGTIIDAARVRPECSFGPNCRIGGEVEASIFLGFANKHHEGFIGHSIIAEWVNLGALTTNSDLRNDYGEVKAGFEGRRPRIVNTGLRKYGCVIADHAKTAIGTLINTGTSIGIFANWFEPGLSPKVIPPFSFGKQRRLKLDEALTTARIVMGRRGVELTANYEKLIRSLYHEQTSQQTIRG